MIVIHKGLFSGMVMQRASDDRSRQIVQGQVDRKGTLLWVCRKLGSQGQVVLRGSRKVRRGIFRFQVTGLKGGGPYFIELRLLEGTGKAGTRLSFTEIFVGDVWLLAGQSNMSGRGLLAEADTPDNRVRNFGLDDRWVIAREPLHNIDIAVDPVQKKRARRLNFETGPGLAFAKRLLRLRKVPQGLISCASPGTSLAEWSPDLAGEGGHSLFGALLRRIDKCGGRVSGLFWYQGENEANNHRVETYISSMCKLIQAIRKGCRDAGMPVVVVQLGRTLASLAWDGSWSAVREAQRKLPERVRKVAVVPSIDLTLDDTIHIRGRDQHVLGRRAAEAMAFLLKGGRYLHPPPISNPKMRVRKNLASGQMEIRLRFSGVQGSLQSGSRPEGFTLFRSHNPLDYGRIVRTELERSEVVLTSSEAFEDYIPLQLSYGYGTNPYANISDAMGRPLPCFGPLEVVRKRAFDSFIRKHSVSQVMLSSEELEDLEYPSKSPGFDFLEREFSRDFCDVREDFLQKGEGHHVIWFRSCYRVERRMRVNLHLGYDGPIKVWLDQVRVFYDPKGKGPAVMNKGCVALELDVGVHEVMVALGNRAQSAWGIYMRFERIGLPRHSNVTGDLSGVFPRQI